MKVSLEVIWDQSPLKFRLNNFEDPAVIRADIVDYLMIKMCYLSCLYRVYMLINKYDEWRLVHSQAKTLMQCYVLCMWERIARSQCFRAVTTYVIRYVRNENKDFGLKCLSNSYT